jgi:hypothetical protein
LKSGELIKNEDNPEKVHQEKINIENNDKYLDHRFDIKN